ncbi:hypothetical protein L083_0812 [Actinoplanes sp. N902-109]|nr:hypothetical protein L083_0812 [Actinoplanes sp. N902-109]
MVVQARSNIRSTIDYNALVADDDLPPTFLDADIEGNQEL